MPTAVSEDLRRRTFEVYQRSGRSFTTLGRRYRVGDVFVDRWVGPFGKSGDVKACPRGGSVPMPTGAQHKLLGSLTEVDRDLSLHQLTERLKRERGVTVSVSVVSRVRLRVDMRPESSFRIESRRWEPVVRLCNAFEAQRAWLVWQIIHLIDEYITHDAVIPLYDRFCRD